MSISPLIKGWCPGAWRPMETGDGWLVRVRPPLGQLSKAQVLALCDAAETYGNGLIELTSRANIQLRGVSEATWPPLMEFLTAHELVSADPTSEQQPQCLLAPSWQAGDETHQLACLLQARGSELAVMPSKVGIAIDAGEGPVLGDTSADFRVERSTEGGLLVRAEGHACGTPVGSIEAAVEHLIRLTHWFVESGGNDVGRMRQHKVPLPAWSPAKMRSASACVSAGEMPGAALALGKYQAGMVYGLPFGRAAAAALRAAVTPVAVSYVRVTPWRRLWVKGASGPVEGLISDNRDTRLLMDACPGAPYCAQASVATQPLARRLVPEVKRHSVHISGCAKGCARRSSADVCLVGQAGRFNLIVKGDAQSTPVKTGLTETEVVEYLESLGAL
ncbi:cobalamin biosynthesis protein CobG [Vreelandella populi]|uniref:Cobalamin biosynthesis protein CobG n=1 Tax=Vreelandella populi TaxID=2498858 RepID=A0A433LH92_9GAMM|nr:cobalamin biosynthesis protein CobG [Halomonas populi]RUR40856.1 cobalamin biosynthesis protein CobG [Halomonas populi]RUR49363.1 cobalamin biosynthesis protein CobG [Halomonas populi]